MVDKKSAILKKQLTKLEDDNFDLEAWKSSSIALLSRLFGPSDPKVKQIENLRIDYGSWALRDASSRYNPVKSCKKVGKEIIEASIDELEAFGPTETKQSQEIIQLLENELKVSQLKSIKGILKSKNSKEEKVREIVKKLNTFPKHLASNLLSKILITLNINEHLD